MENAVEVKKARKRRASIFDIYEEEVKQLLAIGVSVHSAYKIIDNKAIFESTYDGFRKWIILRNLFGIKK